MGKLPIALPQPVNIMRLDQKSPRCRPFDGARPGMVHPVMDTLIPFPLPTDTDDPAKTRDLITRRAEELWRSLGCPEHQDLAIWLEAEAEIRAMRERSFRHPRLPLPQ